MPSRLIVAGIVSALATGVAAVGARAQERPVALRHATVLTAAGPALAGATVVFQHGRIRAVGRDVRVSSDAEVVDLTGRFVMPGIVDPHSHLGVSAWPAVPANNDTTEASDPITPQVRVADAFNGDDPAIRYVVAAGVTTVQVYPGSGNVIGGEGAVVKLKPGRPFEEMLFPGAPRLMKMAVGENPKNTFGRQNRASVTRMGVIALLREAFTRAREYRARWDRR